MVLREVRKIKEDEAAKAHPPEKPERSLSEILKNPKEGGLFGEMLEAEGKGDLAERLVTGKLEPHDMAELENHRKGFVEKMESVREIIASLNEDSIKEFALHVPDLKDVVLKSVSLSELKSVFASQMEQLAFSDPTHFQDIADRMKTYSEIQERAEEWDKDVEEYLRQHGIASKDYSSILAIDDDDERLRKIEELTKRDIGGWMRRAWKGIGKDQFLDIQDQLSSMTRREYDSITRQIENAQQDVGEALALTLAENKNLWDAFNRVLAGENAREKDQERLAGFAEARRWLPESEEKVAEDWERFKKEGQPWDRLNAREQQAKKDTFKEKYLGKMRDRKGKWASITRPLVEFMLGNIPELA